MGAFGWEFPFENVCMLLEVFGWELSFGNFWLGAFGWDFNLRALVCFGKLLAGSVRLGAFGW